MGLKVSFGKAAEIAGITQARLRNFLDRKLVTVEAETGRTLRRRSTDSMRPSARHRRFSESDVLHISLVGEMVRFGMNTKTANKFSKAALATVVHRAVTHEMFIWLDGKTWKFALNGDGSYLGAVAYLSINVHAIRNKVHAGFYLSEHPFRQTQKHSLSALAAR